MAYPGFPIIALALIAVLAILAVGSSVAVWRIRSLTAAGRCGLIGAIALVAADSLRHTSAAPRKGRHAGLHRDHRVRQLTTSNEAESAQIDSSITLPM